MPHQFSRREDASPPSPGEAWDEQGVLLNKENTWLVRWEGNVSGFIPDSRAQGRALGRAGPSSTTDTHRGRRLEEAGDLFSLTTAPSSRNIKKISL